jgi:hypothetical protein
MAARASTAAATAEGEVEGLEEVRVSLLVEVRPAAEVIG